MIIKKTGSFALHEAELGKTKFRFKRHLRQKIGVSRLRRSGNAANLHQRAVVVGRKPVRHDKQRRFSVLTDLINSWAHYNHRHTVSDSLESLHLAGP